MIGKYVSAPAFIISLAVGLFFVYMSEPGQDVVMVYPTPDIVNGVLYKDRAGVCHRVKATEVECPKGGGKSIPVQQ